MNVPKNAEQRRRLLARRARKAEKARARRKAYTITHHRQRNVPLYRWRRRSATRGRIRKAFNNALLASWFVR